MAIGTDFPDAYPHGEIAELFPDIFFVTGTADMGSRLPMRFSRNMTVLRRGNDLTLVNSVRLTDVGLRALEALGDVRHVIRLAAFHGSDDAFYKGRYGAKVWSVNAPYVPGFDIKAAPYFTPDIVVDAATDLPFPDARLIEIGSATPSEGLLLIDREDGIVVSGDCLQNWGEADRFFSLPARVMMKVMGFLKPHNVGPGWLKGTKPDTAEIKALLDLDFAHVLPAHGAPVIGNAKPRYSPAISAL